MVARTLAQRFAGAVVEASRSRCSFANIEAQASVTSKVVLETTDKMQHTLGGCEDGDIIEVSQNAFPKVLAELTLRVSEGRLQTQTEQSWA